MASKKPEQTPQTYAAPAVEYTMQDWHGKFGGNVDGWWAPEGDGPHVLTGILTNFIDKNRSEKLQSNTLVFEVIKPADNVKNGGSEKVPGAKDDGKLHTAPAGCAIGVPEWKQLEGLWPNKAGFVIQITRSADKRSIGKGRSMYDIKAQASDKKVREVEIYSEPDDAAGVEMAPENRFETGAAS